MFVRRERASVTGSQILQQFNSWSACSAQSRDTQMGPKYVIEVLLLGSVVFTLSGYAHSEQVAIEPEAGVRVPHDDGGMVNAEEELICVAMPLLQTLVWRKLQNLHRVLIRILKIERRDARRILVPVRKPLRP